MAFRGDDETVIVVGETKRELGGSEYHRLMGVSGVSPPTLNFELERRTQAAVLDCIRSGFVVACHDCSKGGLGIALAEMAIAGSRGASLDLTTLASAQMRDDELLFSESNSRFILTTTKPNQVLKILAERQVPSTIIGTVGGDSLHLVLRECEIHCNLSAMQDAYMNSLQRVLEPWQK
jgi:phosphoribosylformylglycinamidine synthase